MLCYEYNISIWSITKANQELTHVTSGWKSIPYTMSLFL